MELCHNTQCVGHSQVPSGLCFDCKITINTTNDKLLKWKEEVQKRIRQSRFVTSPALFVLLKKIKQEMLKRSKAVYTA